MFPYFILALVAVTTLIGNPEASAEPKVVDVVFARDVVNREPVRPFEPAAYCENGEAPSRPVPVIDSATERRVFFWHRVRTGAAVTLLHAWFREGIKMAEVALEVKKSPAFRTWSAKRIVPKGSTGMWKVVVSSSPSPTAVLCTAHFIVK